MLKNPPPMWHIQIQGCRIMNTEAIYFLLNDICHALITKPDQKTYRPMHIVLFFMWHLPLSNTKTRPKYIYQPVS